MDSGASPASIAHLERVQIVQHVLAFSLGYGLVERASTALLSAREQLSHVATASFRASS